MTKPLFFGRYELRPDERLLLFDGRPSPMGARAFEVLIALIERRDRVVSKQELLDIAWPGLAVEENNLSVQISALRKVLGPQAIATIPVIGYRFAMSVSDLAPSVVEEGVVATPSVVALDQLLRLGATWLVAKPRNGADEVAWREQAAAAVDLVRHHGGKAHSATDLLTASFASAHAAAACCHGLHELAQAPALRGHALSPLGIGLCAEETVYSVGGGEAALDLASKLAAQAEPGETLMTSRAARHLIISLDGDLQPLGDHDRRGQDQPQEILRLTAPPRDPLGKESVPQKQNLRPTLALIPFTPYANDGAPLALGDIIADQVIAALSRSNALNVISRLSTLAFRDRSASVQRVAHALSADFVVSGRYVANAGHVQLHVELAEAASAQVLWAHTLVDDERAALHADSKMVQELVAGIVQAVFAHEVRSMRSAALPDLASHTLLLAAISLLYRLSQRDFALAHEALQTLRQRAPRHAAPLAWLARWHLFRVVQGQTDSRQEDGRLALDYANHALDLDPDSSLALTMLGNVNTSWLRDLDEAGRLYDQALAINPNESLAWLQKGNALSFAGNGGSALVHAEKALSLSPLDPARHFYLSLLASAALTARNWDRAISAARQSLLQNQEHVSTFRVLTIAQAMSGRLDDAKQSLKQLLRLEPGLTVAAFVARSPGGHSGLALEFGQALSDAGLPAGDQT
jgi:adenylate cyclase